MEKLYKVTWYPDGKSSNPVTVRTAEVFADFDWRAEFKAWERFSGHDGKFSDWVDDTNAETELCVFSEKERRDRLWQLQSRLEDLKMEHSFITSEIGKYRKYIAYWKKEVGEE
jgi:hypothetical protein